MRIAIYHNLQSGGGKRALFEMTRRLAGRHEIDVYSLASADHKFCDLRPFTRRHVVYPYNTLPLARSPFGRINQAIRSIDWRRRCLVEKRVAREINLCGYDVVFVHNCIFGQSPNVLRYLDMPSVYYCAEPPRFLYEPVICRPYAKQSKLRRAVDAIDPFLGLYRGLIAWGDQANTRAARVVLTNSAYSREVLYKIYGLFARVCYLAVDSHIFRPLGLKRENYILSVGAVLPTKGFDFLLRSIACIEPALRPRLVIVSNMTNERERIYLQDLSEQLGIAVMFRSHVSDQELVELYNRAEVTVYTPVMEPFGFVPLESLACGTPVVGVREAGVRESVVDGQTGLLVDRDEACFAEAVRSLLTDPERRDRYGRAGRADVEQRWQWSHCIDAVEVFLTMAARDKTGGKSDLG